MRDTVQLRKVCVTFVCSSRVNHKDCSFYRVSRNKNEILMEILPLDIVTRFQDLDCE